MRGGFSFDGIDIADLDLEYAPDLENTNVYRPTETLVHDETFDGHNGGYYYGSYKSPKEFNLRCIFEEKVIDQGLMAKLHGSFRVGRSGKLVFKRRPWCFYYATVTEVDDREITNYLNGIITIRMKAYYPFARTDMVVNTRNDSYHEHVMLNSALYEKHEQEPITEFADLTEETSFIIGNTGSERAALSVAIAGDAGTGVIISNNTTQQSMKLIAFSKAVTTDVDQEVYVDGINGKTLLRGPQGSKIKFLYHAYGSLELEPAFPCVRNLYITYADGYSIDVANIVHDNYIGLFIFAAGEWRKIVDQPDKHTIVVDKKIVGRGQERTVIMIMNELSIKPVSTMDITKLSFIFKPTFA